MASGCSETTEPASAGTVDALVTPDTLRLSTHAFGADFVVVQSVIRNRNPFAVRFALYPFVQSQGTDGSWQIIDAGQPRYIEDWSFPSDLDASAVGSAPGFAPASRVLTLGPGRYRLVFRYRRLTAVGGSITDTSDREAISNVFVVVL